MIATPTIFDRMEEHPADVIHAQGFRCNRCGVRLTDSTDYGDDDALGLCFECAAEHYANN